MLKTKIFQLHDPSEEEQNDFDHNKGLQKDQMDNTSQKSGQSECFSIQDLYNDED